MKFKYLLATCLVGGSLFASCADEFKDINSKENDISTPNVRFLFAECLNQFEPMDYQAWYYDIPRLGQWGQCIVNPSGNLDNFNLITEQGSIGGHVYRMLRMVNDLRYQISLMSEEDKAKYEYIQYLCNPLLVFVGMNDSDMYGSRQYSEAEMARYTNPPIFLPKYDTQEELVNIWLKELDETINYLTTKNVSDILGTQDFIYNGDLSKWAKLANSLKLKLAARLINTDRSKAIEIANQAISSPAGLLDSADGDLIYNRGKNNNHWNNNFPHGAGHDLLINFLKEMVYCLLTFGSIIRQPVAADTPVVAPDGAVGGIVVLVALHHPDEGAVCTHHDAHMLRPAGAVQAPGEIPVVEDDVAGQGQVAVVLLPSAQVLKQLDLPGAGALRRDDIRHSGLQSSGGDEGGAPGIVIGDTVILGQGIEGVVQVDDEPVGPVVLPDARPAAGGVHQLLPGLSLRLRYFIGKAEPILGHQPGPQEIDRRRQGQKAADRQGQHQPFFLCLHGKASSC